MKKYSLLRYLPQTGKRKKVEEKEARLPSPRSAEALEGFLKRHEEKKKRIKL